MARPLVAIVGRPNVGKSTLFNRLVGQRQAIVSPVPGTTRDRIFAGVTMDELEVTLVDTGGLVTDQGTALEAAVRAQVEVAIEQADALIFLTDAKDGVTAADLEIAESLRRRGKPIVLAVNKVDNEGRALDSAEFYKLGLGEPLPISAYHNVGIYELVRSVAALLPQAPPEEGEAQAEETLKLAIVGRPNVGKSMLMNALLGEERALVTYMPGTTRDALDTPLEFQGRHILLIDTAGIRRRGSVSEGLEQYSVMRAIRAIGRADVVLLVCEATDLAVAQDMHIAGYALEEYKGLVIVVNKWDLAREQGITPEEAEGTVRGRFKFAPFAPVVLVSALKRQGLRELLESAWGVFEGRRRQMPKEAVTRAFSLALSSHPPPAHAGGRSIRFKGIAQTGVNPPTFVIWVSEPQAVHFSYRRYLENRLRETLGFTTTPLRLVYKRGA